MKRLILGISLVFGGGSLVAASQVCKQLNKQLNSLAKENNLVFGQLNIRSYSNACPVLKSQSRVINDIVDLMTRKKCDFDPNLLTFSVWKHVGNLTPENIKPYFAYNQSGCPTSFTNACKGVSFKNRRLKKDLRLLFVGDSLTHANEGNGVSDVVRNLLERKGHTVTVDLMAPGGYSIYQHLSSLTKSKLKNYDWVMIQDQSQVPTFYEAESNTCNPGTHQGKQSWGCSLQGFKTIHSRAKSVGTNLMLEMTWGYRSGFNNKALNVDFLTMTQNLRDGYCALANSPRGSSVPMSPVGLAWQKVYLDSWSNGKNPMASGSLFNRLYSDNKHPSALGSYLFGLVVYASLTGQTPEDISWATRGITSRERNYLQCVAGKVVGVSTTQKCSFPNS